jgi:hypothetical protein
MILLTAVIIILFEAIGEGLLKRFRPDSFIFKWWLQWFIAIGLFALWFFLCDGYVIEVWKLIMGFVFVRFMIFDIVWNLSRGVKWNYYGTTKIYDRIMDKLGSWGWFMKGVLGIVGICFLMGWS